MTTVVLSVTNAFVHYLAVKQFLFFFHGEESYGIHNYFLFSCSLSFCCLSFSDVPPTHGRFVVRTSMVSCLQECVMVLNMTSFLLLCRAAAAAVMAAGVLLGVHIHHTRVS